MLRTALLASAPYAVHTLLRLRGRSGWAVLPFGVLWSWGWMLVAVATSR